MNLKIFTAGSMAEALALVKRRLGPQAVILHTRTYKRGGLFGLFARTVVEITASDSRRSPALAPQRSLLRPSRLKPHPSSLAPTAGDLIRRTYAAAQAELAGRHAQPPAASTTPLPVPPSASPVVPVPIGPDPAQLTRELQAVKRLVGRVMHHQRLEKRDPALAASDPLFDGYLALLQQEVSEELADEVIRAVHRRLDPRQLEDPAAVSRALRRQLAALIPPCDDTAAPAASSFAEPPVSTSGGGGGMRVIAFVGPTGVGKTTTIAKLAACYKLKQKKSVGLLTLDTYRIAAVDQLQTYADIIGVPLRVVCSPSEVAESLAFFRGRGCDVVLIDTAGRSQKDDARLDQLASLLSAANPHEVHLVLCSTCSQAALLDTIQRFSRLRTDRIVFTKLDEAVSFGVLLNVARKVDKRLSFLTTGQEVPHDIEPGRPDRLAALVLGEVLKPC